MQARTSYRRLRGRKVDILNIYFWMTNNPRARDTRLEENLSKERCKGGVNYTFLDKASYIEDLIELLLSNKAE